MLVRTYGLLDGVAKEVVRTFTSNNDESAVRDCETMLADKRTDRSRVKDFILKYLYTMDSSSGEIVDVSQHDVVALASLCDSIVPVEDSSSYDELKSHMAGFDARLKQVTQELSELGSVMNQFNQKLSSFSPALSQVHPVIDQKKGKVLWVKK